MHARFGQAAVMSAVFLLFLSGCASTSAKKAEFTVPDGYEMRLVRLRDLKEPGFVLEPVYRSRLEIMKESAAYKNNRLTAEIAAGTAAAVAAYCITDPFFKGKNQKAGPFISLAASAGAAYAAAAIADVVYDWLAPGRGKNRR